MRSKVTKAIFPVAGMGTRFLPATKSVPKEIMTLVDRPLVQYAIDEARAAGIKEFLFVTSRGKGALEDYFDNAPQLEQALRKSGKTELLDILKSTNMDSGEVAYMRQHKPLGLGHAVWCARRLIGNEPFAVILPDDVIAGETPCLQQMVEAFDETQGNIVAAMEVPDNKASSYGILDIQEDRGDLVLSKGMVEKPAPGTQPSNLAVIGRYILTPTVLQMLNKKQVGAGGEIQLTDAIDDARNAGEEVYGFRFKGHRYDCGSKAGFLQATIAFALARDDLRDDLRDFIHEVVAADKAAEKSV
ncbi:UTP--glucose-1-phosphate uridylyltransferase [Roseovarius sp. M141]|uniref:UTP--glucose-1-phosphate uridylyltransferase n=1 Tax=Roseovarius sp. M141 TaxID=2583806 RepID=UPI0020CC2719|nr:UTP--glucose-1-phosphate uridylyltransferase [Roseovarius sp. M141]MCQ0090993.1 UTP--glucose-1-phosphate uridylyltransferase [Roseovarius sp. M141]